MVALDKEHGPHKNNESEQQFGRRPWGAECKALDMQEIAWRKAMLEVVTYACREEASSRVPLSVADVSAYLGAGGKWPRFLVGKICSL